MAVTFVGASTIYDAGDSWPTTLTITEGDLPAGVANDDRLVLFVTNYYFRKTSPAEPFVEGYSGLSTWDFVNKAQFLGGFATDTFTQIWSYTTRKSATTFPITIGPVDSSGNPAINYAAKGLYRACVAAWRPSYGWQGAANAQASDGQFNNATLSPDDNTTIYGNLAGFYVQANFLSNGNMGAIVTANGFTVRHTQASISGWGGSLTISDQSFTSSGSTSAATFTKPGLFPNNPNGAATWFALDLEDPLGAGWSVGRIAY